MTRQNATYQQNIAFELYCTYVYRVIFFTVQ